MTDENKKIIIRALTVSYKRTAKEIMKKKVLLVSAYQKSSDQVSLDNVRKFLENGKPGK